MNRKSKMVQEQVFLLWKAGFSAKKIAENLGIDRETAGNYLKAAGVELRRGRPNSAINPREVPTDLGSEKQNPQLMTGRCPPTRESVCEPYRSFIEDAVSRGMSAQVIWQDLVDEHQFKGAYDSVKRFAKKLRRKHPEVFAVIPTVPGQEAQVDYGRGALTQHPKTGKYRRPWLFSFKLSHSRRAIRIVVWESSSEIWCKLHEAAFRKIGGVTATVILDNLKEGVLKAEYYDPQLNPLYAALLTHYGVVALPCRVRTPRHKGKVESDIKYTQNALRGRKFESLQEQQDFIDHWTERWSDTCIHGTTKQQVKAVFEMEEKPALKPLPTQNFSILRIVQRRVHPDGHIAVEDAYYSAPAQWVGQELTVHIGRIFIDLIHPYTGERLARHDVIERGRYRTIPDHVPDSKRSDKLHDWLQKRAGQIGPHTAELMHMILKDDPFRQIRKAQGLLSFARQYRYADIENACDACLQRGLYNYHVFKNILCHRESLKPKPPVMAQQHALIRPMKQYQLLWTQKISQPQG